MKPDFKSIVSGLKIEIKTYRLVMADPRTPKAAKVLFVIALGYLALPFDLIPDFLPVIGHLDDAVIIPLLIWIALRMIPGEVMEECRRNARG